MMDSDLIYTTKFSIPTCVLCQHFKWLDKPTNNFMDFIFWSSPSPFWFNLQTLIVLLSAAGGCFQQQKRIKKTKNVNYAKMKEAQMAGSQLE